MSSESESDIENFESIDKMSKPKLKSKLSKLGLSPHGDLRKLRSKLTEHYKSKLKTKQANQESQGGHNISHREPVGKKLDLNLTRRDGDKSADAVGRACDIIRKWNLKFDGEKGAVAFLERLDELKTAYAIEDNDLLPALPELLKGKAILWYRINKSEWNHYGDFLNSFRDNYLPPDYKNTLEDEIRARTQGPDEELRDFVISLRTLMRRHGGVNSKRQLDLLYRNLRPEYKTYIRRHDFDSITELMQLGTEYELLCKESKQFRPPPRSTQSYSADTAYQGRPRGERRDYTAPLSSADTRPRSSRPAATPPTAVTATQRPASRCWNCEATDHTHRMCNAPRGIFCYRCGFKGKTVSSCPRCSTGNDRRTR
jgi:hypothetical protein